MIFVLVFIYNVYLFYRLIKCRGLLIIINLSPRFVRTIHSFQIHVYLWLLRQIYFWISVVLWGFVAVLLVVSFPNAYLLYSYISPYGCSVHIFSPTVPHGHFFYTWKRCCFFHHSIDWCVQYKITKFMMYWLNVS